MMTYHDPSDWRHDLPDPRPMQHPDGSVRWGCLVALLVMSPAVLVIFLALVEAVGMLP